MLYFQIHLCSCQGSLLERQRFPFPESVESSIAATSLDLALTNVKVTSAWHAMRLESSPLSLHRLVTLVGSPVGFRNQGSALDGG